jgi:hypothetical protein
LRRGGTSRHGFARGALGNVADMGNFVVDGMVAGLAGAAAMTLAEKIEQRFTKRPDSYVPALTLGRLVGVQDEVAERSVGLNVVMHVGQAVALGVVRAMMAEGGLRGLPTSAGFTGLRLMNDQTLENYTGSGAPPSTWPRSELVIDVFHKSVYGVVTGLVADRLAARRGPGAGALHARRRPGRQSDVGPVPAR